MTGFLASGDVMVISSSRWLEVICHFYCGESWHTLNAHTHDTHLLAHVPSPIIEYACVFVCACFLLPCDVEQFAHYRQIFMRSIITNAGHTSRYYARYTQKSVLAGVDEKPGRMFARSLSSSACVRAICVFFFGTVFRSVISNCPTPSDNQH